VNELLQNHLVAILALIASVAAFAYRLRFSLAYPLAAFAIGGLSLGKFESLQSWVTLAPFLAIVVALVVLVFGRIWSATLVYLCFLVGVLGLGAWSNRPASNELVELMQSIRSVQFVRPWWLVLLVLVPLAIHWARRSLAGLGTVRRIVAIGSRCAIIAGLVFALAEPRLNKPSENVTVMFTLDRSQSVPQDVDSQANAVDQIDRRWQRIRRFVSNSVLLRDNRHHRDKAGVVLFGKRPKLALPPASVRDRFDVDDRMAGPIDGQYTDIAAALKLAMASFPEGSGKRIVLVSDGNENLGNAEEQAAVAKQNGVQIDVVAIAPGYKNDNEVLVQSVEAPPVTSAGTRLPVRVLVRNASGNRIVRGLLEVVRISLNTDGSERTELVAIDTEQPQVINAERGKPAFVELKPGLNALRLRDTPPKPGESSFSYRATFTPVQSARVQADGQLVDVINGMPNDRIANNRATTAVVTSGQRRVLFVEEPKNGKSQHAHLMRTLAAAEIKVTPAPPNRLPVEPNDLALFLTNYDCIVLANVPAESFSRDQMETIRSAVHDQGTGLIMVGGPDAFGPGGYQKTPVEEALPVECEIKSPLAAGRGGLVLIMHASEMADGNKWQKDIAKLAIERLNPPDMVGVMQYGFGAGAAGVSWVIPFQEVGKDKGRLFARVDRMDPQDMPDFDPFLRAAVDTLTDPQYNLAVKHTILISDGDPQYGAAGKAAVDRMGENGVTCTTVGVATHGVSEATKMKSIAEGTKDGSGRPGSFYEPKDPSQLPAIYIKESRRISQSFIYDKPFRPSHLVVGGITEGIPKNLPPLRGFVRTTIKESPLVQFRIEGPAISDELRFPVLASWQYGLGRSIAFTSDARTQPDTQTKGWDSEWVESDIYKKFWEQAVTWCLRASESGRLTMQTQYRDGRVRVTVSARDEKERPVNGLDLAGKIGLPRAPKPGEKQPVLEFKRKGPGQYEAEFAAEESGTYFVTVQGYQLGAGGKPGAMFDTARSGVTVPYSPEFADLESNTPLLKRLASITGGEFYTDDEAELGQLAKSSSLFRDAPKTSRAYQPFWYWLVLMAGLLLFVDVGVRRIAIELPEIQATANGFWSKLRSEAAATSSSETMGALKRRKQEVAEQIERERAARRFDPDEAPRGDPAPSGADALMSDQPRTSLPSAPPPRTDVPKSNEPQDMMSRLKKAKKRADIPRDDDEPQR
jgi:uncharacterized membrane protein